LAKSADQQQTSILSTHAFWFCLNSPAPIAVIELTKGWCKWDCSGARDFFKMLCLLCLAPPPPCTNATKGYVTTKPEMSMTLRIMMIIMSDSGSIYYDCFCDFWAVWNYTISLLSNSILALL